MAERAVSGTVGFGGRIEVGTLPQQLCRHQAAVSDLEPIGERVGNAAAGVVLAKAQFAVIFGERLIRAIAA